MLQIRRVTFFLSLCVSVLIAGCSGGSSSNSGSGSSGAGGSGTGSSGNSTPAPTVTSISPTSVTAGSSGFTLTVNGTGFSSATTLQLGGVADQTTYVSATQLTATVAPAQLIDGGQLAVIAVNDGESSAAGAAVNLQVNNPAPVITLLTPSIELVDATSSALTVVGTGFVPDTTIQVNGSNRTTTYTSSTQVNVLLTAADLAATGSLSLTAVNPSPGGGTSAATTIPINNPAPGLGILSSNAVVATASGSVTVTVTGTNYVPTSTVQVDGVAAPTTFVNSTQLTFQLATAQLIVPQELGIQVVTPQPGGGAGLVGELWVLASTPTPVLSSVFPAQFIAGSGAAYITVEGSNLIQAPNSEQEYLTATVLWNGTPLTTVGGFYQANYPSYQEITAAVPANLISAVGSANISVTSLTSTPAVSNVLPVAIMNPPVPTITSLSPNAGPIGTAASIALQGTGFTANTTVALNGVTIPSTYTSSGELTATIPASSLALPGNVSLTVSTPAPGGGTSAPLTFTAYLGITNNDIAYNSANGLLYASIPGSVTGIGNSVVAIDPATGNIQSQIFVGSNPNKLALSTDGTQLFVGVDGAASIAQINLATGKVVSQFYLGQPSSDYENPPTALYLAAVPGQPNSVAVVFDSLSPEVGAVIYDSGVARAGTSFTYDEEAFGPIAFGSSASTLYMASTYGFGVERFTVGPTGITAGSALTSNINGDSSSSLQYDNGYLYQSDGIVLNAATGDEAGTFYANSATAANGPIISDSTLGLAFVAESYIESESSQVQAFSESTYNPAGSIQVNTNNSYSSFNKILRWGQNGLAINTPTQIYLFQSSVVKNLSSSPADLSVTLTAPSTAATGTAISYVATVKNNGPNPAQDATLSLTLDSSLIVNSITPSQGTCGTGPAFNCDLGSLANGSSATVTVSAVPSTAATIAGQAGVTSVSYDPTTTNNQATTSTTVTGSEYSMAPAVTAISPNLVQAGSAAFTLTVTGSGFNSASTVNLGNTALTTTYVSSTQLTADVEASSIANYGWAPVTVSNPSPGGGTSQVAPLTICGVVNIPANSILFDPYSQQIYASVSSPSTTVAGNSVVAINPVTAGVGTPVLVGSQPDPMAETSDGNYLYVGLNGADSLVQFNLATQSVQATIPLSNPGVYPYGAFPATSLTAMPGSDSTVAVDNSSGAFILDINGTTGTFRADAATGTESFFPDASHLYTDNGGELNRYSINATGATLIDSTSLSNMYNFDYANGLIFGQGGGIANAASTPPAQLAELELPQFYQDGIYPEGVAVVADPSIQKDFLVLENNAGISEFALARYSTTTYLPEQVAVMPAAINAFDAQWSVVRWGQAGLALLYQPNDEITPGSTAEILLIDGPFVTPQLLGSNTAATLTSSSVTSVTHGSGNTLLTLTGSNFAPGVAVTWNGSYRTTTIVDATHVTVAIPASDLAAAGSGSLVATNPGGPASNALTITIN